MIPLYKSQHAMGKEFLDHLGHNLPPWPHICLKLSDDKCLSSHNFLEISLAVHYGLSQNKASYIMQFKTRQMDLAKALDEVFLRLFLLGLRVLQALVSIHIIGFGAAIISDFSDADLRLPSKAAAVEAVACVCVTYIGLTFLPIFFVIFQLVDRPQCTICSCLDYINGSMMICTITAYGGQPKGVIAG
jgi:hypothetical protein